MVSTSSQKSKETHLLVKQAYLISKLSNKKTSWANGIKKLLNQYKISEVWNNNNILLSLDGKGNQNSKTVAIHTNFWKKYITSKILDVEQDKWLKKMEKKSKLRTYKIIKNKLCLEKYLCTTGILDELLHISIRIGSNF